MWHPLQSAPYIERRRLLYVVALLAVGAMAGIDLSQSGLKTDAAPLGGLSLQLAGEPYVANSILASWGAAGIRRAMFGLGLDFLFIPCYAVLLSVACLWAAKKIGRRFPLAHTVGEFLAWAALIAALADCGENFCLFHVLLGSVDGWAQAARLFSLSKWALIVSCLVFALIGAYAWAMDLVTAPRTLNRAVSR
jgi:hypothetical protein